MSVPKWDPQENKLNKFPVFATKCHEQGSRPCTEGRGPCTIEDGPSTVIYIASWAMVIRIPLVCTHTHTHTHDWNHYTHPTSLKGSKIFVWHLTCYLSNDSFWNFFLPQVHATITKSCYQPERWTATFLKFLSVDNTHLTLPWHLFSHQLGSIYTERKRTWKHIFSLVFMIASWVCKLGFLRIHLEANSLFSEFELQSHTQGVLIVKTIFF